MRITQAKKRILVVDDEPSVRDSLVMILERDYEVLQAASGPEALALLDGPTDEVSLVIADLRMNEMPGDQLMEKIRERKMQMPFVIVTGTPISVDDHVRPIYHEASDVVTKPFGISQITTAVKKAVG